MITKESMKLISNNRKILIQDENFAYLLPSKSLQSYISNFTITFPDKSMLKDNYTILPHGSATLVFFSYHNEWYSFLFGPTSKPVKVGDLANKCDTIWIIEFQPAGIYPFIKTSQKEMMNKIIPFAFLEESLDKKIRTIIKSTSSIDEVLHNIEDVLIQHLKEPYPKEIANVIKVIIQHKGVMTSSEVLNVIGYSTRHLNRLCNVYLGMSIKAFTRLVRINNAMRLLNERKHTIANVCEILNYYDESHVIKEFNILCGMTPQTYKKNMSTFYNEIAKF